LFSSYLELFYEFKPPPDHRWAGATGRITKTFPEEVRRLRRMTAAI
jgi:hypothetical protein